MRPTFFFYLHRGQGDRFIIGIQVIVQKTRRERGPINQSIHTQEIPFLLLPPSFPLPSTPIPHHNSIFSPSCPSQTPLWQYFPQPFSHLHMLPPPSPLTHLQTPFPHSKI